MVIKPTKELMQDFTKHLGWKWVEGWIKSRQDSIKGFLLNAKDFEEVRKYQIEHDTYQGILNKIKSLSEKEKQ